MTIYQDEVWTSSNGRRTAVCDLHPEHMRNIIRQMIKARAEREAFFEVLAEREPELLLALQEKMIKIEEE